VGRLRQAILQRDESIVERRQFLRGAATVTALGTAGCLDNIDVEPGTDEPPSPDGVPPSEEGEPYERAIHERVNEVRQEHDLETLTFSESIATVAREHSHDMAERDYFAHESPEGEQLEDRMSEFMPGYCRLVGENLASVGIRSEEVDAVADRIVSGWMESPGHRENVLRDGFDEQGIGVALTDDRLLATQNFCGRT